MQELYNQHSISEEEALHTLALLQQNDPTLQNLFSMISQVWESEYNTVLNRIEMHPVSRPQAIQLSKDMFASLAGFNVTHDIISINLSEHQLGHLALTWNDHVFNEYAEYLYAVMQHPSCIWVGRDDAECVFNKCSVIVPTSQSCYCAISPVKGFTESIMESLDKAATPIYNLFKETQVENPELISQLVGMSAILHQFAMCKRTKQVQFNWNSIMKAQGDAGIYLQYTHARLCGIERKNTWCSFPHLELSDVMEAVVELSEFHHPSFDPTGQVMNLVYTLSKLPNVLQVLKSSFELSKLASYLVELSRCISSATYVLRVKGERRELALARLALLNTCKRVLYYGMSDILGCYAAEYM
jgi:hypothetical protein